MKAQRSSLEGKLEGACNVCKCTNYQCAEASCRKFKGLTCFLGVALTGYAGVSPAEILGVALTGYAGVSPATKKRGCLARNNALSLRAPL